MASKDSLISEESFQCSICLDVFINPVTIPCGHTYCKSCIEAHWDGDSRCLCPLCQTNFVMRPVLHVNTAFRDVVDQFKKMNVKEQTISKPREGRVGREGQQIQMRLDMIEKLNMAVEINKKNACTDTEAGIQLTTSLVKTIEIAGAALVKQIGEKQNESERRAKKLIKILELEISEIQRGEIPGDHWSDTSVYSDSGVPTVRGNLGHLLRILTSEIQSGLKASHAAELKRIQKYAVNVTLDPDTAHPGLILSENRKRVRNGDRKRNLLDNPERFDSACAVLGLNGFSSGSFYFEVQVKDKLNWVLGVAKESVDRKGKIHACLQEGYVVLSHKNGTEYVARDHPPVTLSLSQKPQKVGIFVEYESGQVSFYDVDHRSHIYSFTNLSYSDMLHPYFNPCANDSGANSVNLVITPVEQY